MKTEVDVMLTPSVSGSRSVSLGLPREGRGRGYLGHDVSR